MHRDREAEREILAHFESLQDDEECAACKKIAETGGYTSTLGVVHTYRGRCKHASEKAPDSSGV